MDIPENARLEKLLGMLGSSFDGERANAARVISAMAEKHGLTIVELIYGARGQEQRLHPRQSPGPEPPNDDLRARPVPDTMLKRLAQIADNPDRYEVILTEWEFQFAVDVSARYSRDYELSTKQHVIVEKILRKAQRSTARK
ncbi:hypothetical protein [Bradyrhizobium sp. MOS002]|uniref:hypothetical protein n=1 Tax=Bradyrhizobium sp. MOS002 TaxID=2133947 RepID=UPI001304BFCB|nr:hypothetical protein [Bradyrhizobium sp. MOS002]